ncbi:hypothetical protein MJA45_24165 [Paenibacillus aurantius]|uniref:Uncharacterized protein n=1 Tax=Paenibacillus aurantius TaxID=2918900 RepID=A0AA96LEM9_9BACL|nr:hypothetical protein [Paenibacillus aurantius]WNQ10681.1 hypothetical protein MJA45_24165 [Paenibacillus aurantius]
MRKALWIWLVILSTLNGCSSSLPVYQEENNFRTVKIKGTEYALHKLSYGGKTYISEPEQYINPAFYKDLKLGKQIGKTEGGMRIYQVKNEDERVVMMGLMFPELFYKLE